MKISAGILVFRIKNNQKEVLLVHPGGPFWQNKNENSWSIPKGEVEKNEDLLEAAIREFQEETGLEINEEDKKKIFYLGKAESFRKIVYVYALEKNFGDHLKVKSNLIEIEHPPQSGRKIKFPEVDKIAYFDLKIAQSKLINYQKPILVFLNK